MHTIGIYEIAEEMGRGAVGIVYRGFDPAIGRPVAIKIIPPNLTGSPEEHAEVKRRFAREATAAGRLSHPNIVTIYQLGEERGASYMAMEFVDGPSLEQILVAGRPVAPRDALAILTPIASALDYAHRMGVIHRDIKPGNIILGPDGRVKLTDFGIARIATQPITQAGQTMGTPAYIAPEQLQGGLIDGRTDQFSLGVMAFQILTGHRPLSAESNQALLFRILQDEPPEAHTLNRFLPAACSPILARAMSKDADLRFENCLALIDALRTCLLSPPKRAPAPRRRPQPELKPEDLPPPPGFLPKVDERRFGRAAMVSLALALLGLAAGAYYLSRG